MAEAWFHAFYGAPVVQAMAGLRASDSNVRRRPGKDLAHNVAVARRIEELTAEIAKGGPREAILRALLYIRMPDGHIDERGFNLLRRARDEAGEGLSLAEFKQLVREQFFMLLLDERRAVDAIPAMLAEDRDLASLMAGALRRTLDAVGVSTDLAKARLAEIEELLDTVHLASGRREKRSGQNAVRAKTHTAAGSKR